jgi:hypothetical protein
MHAIQSKQASMSSGCIVAHPEVIGFVDHASRWRRFFRCSLGRFQFPIPVDLNLLLASGQHILRRDIADGTVQADALVMLDLALNQTQRIVQRKRCSRPDALAL